MFMRVRARRNRQIDRLNEFIIFFKLSLENVKNKNILAHLRLTEQILEIMQILGKIMNVNTVRKSI